MIRDRLAGICTWNFNQFIQRAKIFASAIMQPLEVGGVLERRREMPPIECQDYKIYRVLWLSWVKDKMVMKISWVIHTKTMYKETKLDIFQKKWFAFIRRTRGRAWTSSSKTPSAPLRGLRSPRWRRERPVTKTHRQHSARKLQRLRSSHSRRNAETAHECR